MTIPYTDVRSALRKLWLWGTARRAALKQARVLRGYYLCAYCRLPTKEPEVDHVVPVGPTPGAKGATTDWNGFMERLFCPPEGLQILCKNCHQRKTSARRAG